MQRHAAMMIVASMLGLATMACNLYPGVPATPTLIPTYETPTATPIVATQVGLRPSQTYTPSSTPTITQTNTAIPSTMPSATQTDLPTHTPSMTFTASVTPVIVTMTFTAPPPTRTLTITPLPSSTPSMTFTPSVTPLPLLYTNTPTNTRTPQPITNPATVTSAPSAAPLPVTFTPLPVALVGSSTPRPTASQPSVTQTRQIIVITSTPRPQITEVFGGTPIPIPADTSTPIAIAAIPTAGFEQLPNGQSQIAGNVLQPPIRDAQGQLVADFDVSRDGRQVIISVTGQATINGVPYVGDNKHNRQRFLYARWSPDGRYLAYIVQREGAESGTLGWADTIDDGVWVLDSAPGSKPKHIYRNSYVRDSNDFPYRMALALQWANDSYALLITVDTVAGLSTVLAGINGEMQLFPTTPGTWLADNSGWVATQTENGTVTLVSVDRNGPITPLINGLQAGLWMQNPAQLADGRYAFLGKPALNGQLENGANDLRLYVYTAGEVPFQVSVPLVGEVLSAEWSPNRNALLVHLRTTDGIAVQVITADGTISDYTSYANGMSGTHWLR